MPYVYTQNIKKQEDKILEVFDPEYVIKSSRAVSIVKEQDSVLSVRDLQIKEYKDKVEQLEKEYKDTLLSILKENNNIEDSVLSRKQVESTTAETTKRFSGFFVLDMPEFDIDKASINVELFYSISKVRVGIRGQKNVIGGPYTYSVNIGYKFL